MNGLPLKEKLLFAGLLWLAVYPAVLGANLLLRAIGQGELPLPVSVFLTTLATVPILEFVMIPKIKALVSKAEDAFDWDGDIQDRGAQR